MRDVLPRGWFSDSAPVTDTILASIGSAWEFVYGLTATASALTRISTSTGIFLDAISKDFFGNDLLRRTGEDDSKFLIRIRQELFRLRGTRLSLNIMLEQLTGNQPYIFEPARPGDTGGYNTGGVGYAAGGGYGNLALSHACFVTASRPNGQGIAELAGYAKGGVVAYGNLAMVASPTSDSEIFAATAAVLPLGCTAWLRIQ